jgi:hypothetical protein
MRTIVSVQDVLELEIKPDNLLAEYYALTEQAVKRRLAVASELRPVPCPGCGSSKSERAFEKFNLTYRQCRDCASLYVSPRPSEAALADYYRHSPAARFWREHILPATEAARREKIIEPRAQWVLDGIAEYTPYAAVGLDISSYGAALATELLRSWTSSVPLRLIAANPLADLDFNTPPEGVEVAPRMLADVPSLGPVDFITAFDLLDRCDDVPAFLRAVSAVLPGGGLLFLTAPSISGFDLQNLWDRSRTISPPDRLNLLSTEGFTALFTAPVWEICEFSTPGMFDVEAVRLAIEADPDGGWPRFIHYLLKKRDKNALLAFQEYLQQYRLSSFARIVVRKTA